MAPIGSTLIDLELVIDKLDSLQLVSIIGLSIVLLTAIFTFAVLISCLKLMGIAFSIERFIKAWRSGKGKENDIVEKKPRTRQEVQADLINEFQKIGGKIK